MKKLTLLLLFTALFACSTGTEDPASDLLLSDPLARETVNCSHGGSVHTMSCSGCGKSAPRHRKTTKCWQITADQHGCGGDADK